MHNIKAIPAHAKIIILALKHVAHLQCIEFNCRPNVIICISFTKWLDLNLYAAHFGRHVQRDHQCQAWTIYDENLSSRCNCRKKSNGTGRKYWPPARFPRRIMNGEKEKKKRKKTNISAWNGEWTWRKKGKCEIISSFNELRVFIVMTFKKAVRRRMCTIWLGILGKGMASWSTRTLESSSFHYLDRTDDTTDQIPSKARPANSGSVGCERREPCDRFSLSPSNQQQRNIQMLLAIWRSSSISASAVHSVSDLLTDHQWSVYRLQPYRIGKCKIAVISFLHICRSLIVPHTHTPNESIVSTLVAVVACHAWLPSTIFICVRLNGNILEDLIGLLYIIISSKWIGLLFWEGTESTVCRVSCAMCDVLEYWIAFWWSSSFNNNYCAIYIRYSNFSYSSVRLLLGLWSPVASLSLLHTVIRMLAGCVCNEHGIVMILIKNGMEEES